MASKNLRIDQYPTILYNANLNPLGIPESVKKAISENIDSIMKYPDIYYNNLKNEVASYTGVELEKIVMGNGSSDLYKLYAGQLLPKKALLLSPGPTEYERVLTSYGCKVDYYDLKEENEFVLDMEDFISKLDESYDVIYISHPNNPTSKKLELQDIEALAKACKELNIFLVIDEMYIEFLDDYKNFTSISLVDKYSNMAVIRSVSKFFAVPGLRFAYAIMNNSEMMDKIDIATTKNNIASISAIAASVMFKDEEYIKEGHSLIHTERSLIYRAMSTSKNLKLFKPDANFMLVKLLSNDINSSIVSEHCNQRGIIIRRCNDFRGLSDKYIRFCFMNPKQNDLMVNTILEIV